MRVKTEMEKLRGVWREMVRRCTDPKDRSYKNYGGRGINVCPEWANSFEAFAADMGVRPIGFTVERKDNDAGYNPSNCCWAPRKTQSRNQRSNRLIEHDGETLCLGEWAERLGHRESFIRRRMDVQGMSFAEAITAPKRYAVWRHSVARMEQERGLA